MRCEAIAGLLACVWLSAQTGSPALNEEQLDAVKKHVTGGVYGAGGESKRYFGRIDGIDLGGLMVRDPVAGFATETSEGALEFHRFECDGIEPGSPAERAGLKTNDALAAIDGHAAGRSIWIRWTTCCRRWGERCG